jgi:hypothetical protein
MENLRSVSENANAILYIVSGLDPLFLFTNNTKTGHNGKVLRHDVRRRWARRRASRTLLAGLPSNTKPVLLPDTSVLQECSLPLRCCFTRFGSPHKHRSISVIRQSIPETVRYDSCRMEEPTDARDVVCMSISKVYYPFKKSHISVALYNYFKTEVS